MNYKQIPHKELIKGMKSWTNPNNKFRILAIHYTADPDKDPDRDGKEWYEKEKVGFPRDKWNKEYEIDFSSKSGRFVFGPEYCDFNSAIHFIGSRRIEGEKLFSLDFGQSNPNAGLIGIYDKTGTLYIVDEYYKPAIPSVAAREMFKKFSGYMGKTEEEISKLNYDQKRDLFLNTFQVAVIDPTTRAKNRTTKKYGDEQQFSVLEDFYDNGMDFSLGNNDWEASITRIREYFKIDEKNRSSLYIFADKCPNLCWELQKYKYKEQSESQERVQNKSERPVKKHDHAIDSLRYMIMTRPNRPEVAKKELTWVQKDMQRLMKPQDFSQLWDVD